MSGSSLLHPAEQAATIQKILSPEAQVLLDPESAAFKTSMSRWTDVGKQTPSAILKPENEADVEKTVPRPSFLLFLPHTKANTQQVATAIQNKIPFVAKSGGNSPWSTISNTGWIIDLANLDKYKLDTQAQTATFGPGVLSKTINSAVEDVGFCIQSPGSALVSCIGFLLGGGSSYLNGIYGMAVDSLLSARVVTTRGMVTCNAEENSDLFWAIKGAGQFFGVVTEVTMKIFPLKEEEGPLSWTLIFPSGRIGEVATVLQGVSRGEQVARSPGLAMVLSFPGSDKVSLSVGELGVREANERDV
jgi:FAD/FMN-containing dehydrogenase